MKKHIVPLVILIFLSCKEKVSDKNKSKVAVNKQDTAVFVGGEQVENTSESEIKEILKNGFLFINIADIYHRGGELTILDEKEDTIAFFKKTKIYTKGKKFDIIEEEHLYENNLRVKYYNPEYGLFILECDGITAEGYYKVKVNGEFGYVNKDYYDNVSQFKSYEEYVYDGFYYLDKTNYILRVSPHLDSIEITHDNYKKYFFKPVEIKGDWLKLKDDKDCPLGEYEVSEEDIEGWIQWREDGKIIVDFSYRCW